MFDPAYEKEVSDLARSLWGSGVRRLIWSAHPATAENPWVEGWADVYIEELCLPLQANWLVTILSPENRETEGYGCLKVSRDAEVVFEFTDPEGGASRQFFVASDGTQRQIPLLPEDDEWKNDFYWSAYKKDLYLDQDADILTYRIPVWSVHKIAEVVADWLEQISGHRFLLDFNPESKPEVLLQAQQISEDIAAGRAKTFDLGDGLVASEQAFDAFLADPDMAAEIIETIRREMEK